ncbi:tRNA (cytidine(34)-2'-O)-methyltransferase [Sphingomonas paeninsulae]|jgi:tRNA (cytidine/uridine-2'-O-)-methyltransferase|uniref:tRNA (cytidine(34)-2'-O)-methyltransferase n=1 Tax=Sphingomonas paeninsulae TaxID=2319844 RepID=A0A494TQ46_SPHPE|nr:tRNA (cytidine(34)-2'-O)-methyltransferase [Sphingomonas paeninsulae]AYJ87225.1 tRNA (cytidine(34)-2'-O)-methyltransferase [Sphingomonas paeninsulae]
MRIALYQPEIAGNVGAILRLAACFGVGVDLIEPCGFVFSDAKLKRAGMDYIDHVELVRHSDWDSFRAQHSGRLMLMTTRGNDTLHDASFLSDDILLFGNEGSGVPDEVAAACDARLRIAIRREVRSFNLSVACAIAVAEALRQTGGLPE